MQIVTVTYIEQRLQYFKDKQEEITKNYERLKTKKHHMLSEHMQVLSDLGMEISFYNDIIELLEKSVITKSELNNLFEELEQEAYKNEEGDLYLDLPDYLKIKKKYIGE